MRGELPLLRKPINVDNPIVYLDICIGKENGIKSMCFLLLYFLIEYAIELYVMHAQFFYFFFHVCVQWDG